MEFDSTDAIDSRCRVSRERDIVAEAGDWVRGYDGTRWYVSKVVAREMLRFADDETTLDDLSAHPRAGLCRACRTLTLTDDLDPATRHCLDCRDVRAKSDPRTAPASRERDEGDMDGVSIVPESDQPSAYERA